MAIKTDVLTNLDILGAISSLFFLSGGARYDRLSVPRRSKPGN